MLNTKGKNIVFRNTAHFFNITFLTGLLIPEGLESHFWIYI